MSHRARFVLAALILAAMPAAAFAHPGHGTTGAGFASGLLHPLTGVDHLLATLAIGLWSGMRARRAWLAPAAFLACLALGAVLGSGGLRVPGTESLVAASVLAAGLLLAWGDTAGRWPIAMAGGFAIFHGLAHGAELAAGGIAPLAGMMAASALLVGGGLLAARASAALARRAAAPIGVTIAACGAVLLLALR